MDTEDGCVAVFDDRSIATEKEEPVTGIIYRKLGRDPGEEPAFFLELYELMQRYGIYKVDASINPYYKEGE